MIRSMTGFATSRGEADGYSRVWDMRGVNGRGLDLRLRLPDGIDGLEAMVRARLGKSITRGSVTVSLRLTREDSDTELALDLAQLDRVLGAFARIEDAAAAKGVTLVSPTPADVLAQRGVVNSSGGGDVPSADLVTVLQSDLDQLIEAFDGMRKDEGARLHSIIMAQLDTIADLTDAAARAAQDRKEDVKTAMTAALRRLVEDVTEVGEDRLAQELALLAVKQDVTEELDRLTAHVAAARDLLAQDIAVGRKLDFLAQEFNREANTLCSKAQNAALTAIGLELKASVDQMREQIQNVE